MKRRSVLSALSLIAAATVGLLPLNAAPASPEAKKAYFIDILYLNPGKTPADAKAYFDRVRPVVAKHGLTRIAPGFVITQKMAGDIEPNLINVWSVSDPQNTFNDIFADPAYLKNTPIRDATFDMQRSHMFMMRSAD